MTQVDLIELEKLDPVSATIAAWVNPGPGVDDGWHRECKIEVANLMPLLAQSLDRLVALMKTFDEIREDTQEALADQDIDLEPPQSDSLLDDGAWREMHTLITRDEEADSAVAGADADPEPDYTTATVEEMGERALRATVRLKVWGRRKEYREKAEREARLRERIIIHLNNRVETNQREIGELMGLSSGRIATIVGRYYDRLNRDDKKWK
jgi:hypothetical protein